MRIAVSGSIATDHLMHFPGRFSEQLVADRLRVLSLSFLVDRIDIRRGGAGANIAFGLGVLGLTPLLVGAAGADFDDYRAWLEQHGVDTGSVVVVPDEYTARFVCTTDADQNQIGSFHAGAMRAAADVSIEAVAERAGGLDLVVLSPDTPDAMLRHTEECRAAGLPFAADPSQQIAAMSRADVQFLIGGARYLFTNEYEARLLQERTGWSARRILDQVGTWVTTLGADGVLLERDGREPRVVPAVPDVVPVDVTGAGDALRAGMLAGIARGLTLEDACRLGCVLASLALETVGTQEYGPRATSLADRVRAVYGDGPATAGALAVAGAA
ncbi:carbohydrate kinase family protein [Streptomyces sp. NPDC049597]|uniref:carbohydrate kinase family protein n=1 Tax=Streptomyces sp. NPDC049597 TaxID=3155276 RepID=UPI0034135AB6